MKMAAIKQLKYISRELFVRLTPKTAIYFQPESLDDISQSTSKVIPNMLYDCNIRSLAICAYFVCNVCGIFMAKCFA